MRFLIPIFLAFSFSARSTTYYVRTDGSDSNTGTSDTAGGAFRNGYKAGIVAVAGDHVYLRQGSYGQITNVNSGTAANPIIFEGERNTNGWLTYIDPSVSISNTWNDATAEMGAGVWKSTNAPWPVRELYIGDKRVAFGYSNGIMSSISSAYSTVGLTAGTNFLQFLSGTNITIAGGPSVTWWDSVGAFWIYRSNGTHDVYLRLRDGSSPNTLDTRVARNKDSAWGNDIINPAIRLETSYVIWTNIAVKNAFAGIYMNGADAHHNVIVSNNFSGCYSGVAIVVGSATNYIYGNTFNSSYYGLASLGAWANGTSSTYYNRENVYKIAKELMTPASATLSDQIYLFGAGNSNIITANIIDQGMGTGISVTGNTASYKPYTNSLIFGNYISNQVSVGILLSVGHTETQVYKNRLVNSDINLRFHQMDNLTNRNVYVFRNFSWLPNYVGDHIYCHFNNGSASAYISRWLVINNSFSGGNGGIETSSFAWTKDGLTNFFAANNLFNDTQYWASDDSAWTNGHVGMFAYNLITPPFPSYPNTNRPTWFDASNIAINPAEMTSTEDMNFRLLPGSRAIDAGTNYSAYAADQVLQGSAWDIGALEYVPSGTPARFNSSVRSRSIIRR